MPSILLITFLVQLLIHIVNTFGASTINELLWSIYTKLPFSISKDTSESLRLRREVVKAKREMASVSAQDEFSRWAKLRRQHDKIVTEHEAVSSRAKATRARFDTIVNGLRWAGTTGLRFLLQFWFSKAALFWLPRGWVPYYGEWLLSFPRAPLGAVSVQVWWIACAGFIALVGEAIAATATLVGRGKSGSLGREKVPMAMPASSSMEEKKEL